MKPPGEPDRIRTSAPTGTSPLDRAHDTDGLRCREGISAASLTTFGVGAPVPRLYEPSSAAAVVRLLVQLAAEGAGHAILGAGSNVVLPDTPLAAPVIRLGRELSGMVPAGVIPGGDAISAALLDDLIRDATLDLPLSELTGGAALHEGDAVSLFVGAATPLMRLSRELSQRGLSGLEFAAGIPASLGGATRMNAGAHGHSMQEVVRSVLIVVPGEAGNVLPVRRISAESLRYRYRESALPEGAVILGAELELRVGEPGAIAAKRASCLEYRRSTQPLHLPSAGSVFRNPSPELLSPDIIAAGGGAAGWLLERAGLKGERKGGVEFSTLHANWLVRTDDSGRAADVAWLQREGVDRVRAEFGVELHSEIILW